jgi:hypothetical protein
VATNEVIHVRFPCLVPGLPVHFYFLTLSKLHVIPLLVNIRVGIYPFYFV